MFAATTPENTPMAYRASTSVNPNPLCNNDLRAELEYFSEDYNEEREMEPRPEPTRFATPPIQIASPRIHRRGGRTVGFKRAHSRGESMVKRNTKGGRPLKEAPKGNGGQSVNLPPLLAAYLGRGENGQPFQPSLTLAYRGQAPPNNIGGNLPSNSTFLSHHAQPFIHAILSIPNQFMPTHIHPYQQPTSYVNGQHLSFPMQTLSGNLLMRGIPAHLPQGGHAPHIFANSNMPSHNGDPDNFLHLFKRVIWMQKWLMPVAWNMFTYTLKDSARILWNSQKAGSILDYEDLKAKFQSMTSLVEHVSTDLPPTYKGLMEKTYTWVKAREVANNGALGDRRDNFERSKKKSWDNNKGQKNKYRFSPYQGPNHGLLPNLSKIPKEILATEKAARSFEPPPKMFENSRGYKLGTTFAPRERNKKERTKSSDISRGESKKYKGTAPSEAPILMVSRVAQIIKSLAKENTDYKGKEIIFPLVEKVNNAPIIIEAKIFGRKVGRVYMDSRSSCEIIYQHCFEKLNPTIQSTKVDLKTPLVGFLGERS
ncbi:hypothetical protein Tco_1084518 [Tanacetum coccineum]